MLKSNIAACHLKLEDWKAAVDSATTALDALDRLLPPPKKAGSNQLAKEEGGKNADQDGDADGAVVEIVGDGEEAEQELARLKMSDQRRDDILRIRAKALMRRAKAKSELGGWGNLQGAEGGKTIYFLSLLPFRGVNQCIQTVE